MAGQRLARATFAGIQDIVDGGLIKIEYVGTRYDLVARTTPTAPNEFSATALYSGSGFAAKLQQLMARLGLPYVVDTVVISTIPGLNIVTEVTLTALVYDLQYDIGIVGLGTLGQSNQFSLGVSGTQFPALTVVNTIMPVNVVVRAIQATVFGATDGAIALTATGDTFSNRGGGIFTYRWADDITAIGPNRANLAAGTYVCIVTNWLFVNSSPVLGLDLGANTTVTVVITSDPRLEVVTTTSGNTVTLTASGGLPGYTYLWGDGPTGPVRQNLATGSYTCTVTDARGTTRVVTVTLDDYRFYWSQNPVTLDLDAGPAYRANPASKPNLSFVCQCWIEPDYLSGTFVQVAGQLEQPADRQGRTTFDVQALLDAYLSEHLPALNQARISRAEGVFKRFYLKYGQKFGTPPVVSPLAVKAQNYVVLGGLSFEEYPTNIWFDSYQANARPFLTWEPNGKSVLPAQPEYLYFMPNSFALASFRYWLRLRYADGSTQSLVQETVANVQRYEVYCLPAGFAQLGLAPTTGAQNIGSPVVAWDVWVSDLNDVAQTEVRRYLLDGGYHPQQRFFLYTNSLGGVNTLAALGEGKLAVEAKGDDADRPQLPAYEALLGDAEVLERTLTPTLSVSTGPRRRAQLVADQELLLSRRVVLQSGGQYWPGRVKAKALPLVDEASGLASLEFDFVLTRQRRFSPRLPVSAAGRSIAPVAGGEGAQP